MTKNEITYWDFIEYKDGHIEILYTLGHDSDEVYMKDAEPIDKQWIHRRKRIDAMPDEMSVRLW